MKPEDVAHLFLQVAREIEPNEEPPSVEEIANDLRCTEEGRAIFRLVELVRAETVAMCKEKAALSYMAGGARCIDWSAVDAVVKEGGGG